MKNLNKPILSLIILVFVGFTSCKKFLEVGPPKTEIVSAQVFNNNVSATDAVLSIYGDMMASSSSIMPNTTALLGQAADEMQTAEFAPESNYYTNSLLTTIGNDNFWSAAYKDIYYANNALSNLSASTALTPAIKQQLIGESLFIRAFMHFYLVNLFGRVPYITSSDYTVTSVTTRMPVDEVYTKIIADLIRAKALLTNNFPDIANNNASERIRANKGAAGALLARVYLYHQDWKNAELEADSIINNSTNYGLLDDLNAVFLKNSKETILSIPTTDPSNPNTFDATKYILTGAPSAYGQQTLSLRTDFCDNAFEAGDKRKVSWIGTYSTFIKSYYPYKYKANIKTGTAVEYWIVLRLAEQYLIRAEARAERDNIPGAVADLNKLRARARATPADLLDFQTNISKNDCLVAIMKERRVELFAEGGHRWLDLKRTGKADAVLGLVKGNKWQTTDQLFPIPTDTQLNYDPAMAGDQNPGY